MAAIHIWYHVILFFFMKIPMPNSNRLFIHELFDLFSHIFCVCSNRRISHAVITVTTEAILYFDSILEYFNVVYVCVCIWFTLAWLCVTKQFNYLVYKSWTRNFFFNWNKYGSSMSSFLLRLINSHIN